MTLCLLRRATVSFCLVLLLVASLPPALVLWTQSRRQEGRGPAVPFCGHGKHPSASPPHVSPVSSCPLAGPQASTRVLVPPALLRGTRFCWFQNLENQENSGESQNKTKFRFRSSNLRRSHEPGSADLKRLRFCLFLLEEPS